MNPIRVRLPAALLGVAIAAVALPVARGEVDAEVLNADRISGTLLPATERETFRVACPAQAVLRLRAKGSKRGPSLAAELQAEDGTPLATATASGPSAALLQPLPASGRYQVQVTSRDSATPGDYRLTISWKSPKSFPFEETLAATERGVPFSADAGAVVRASVSAGKGSAALPVAVRVDGPEGFSVALAPPLAPGPTARVPKLTLPATGDYVLVLRDDGAVGGAVRGSVRVKPPKPSRRTVDVSARVLGAGEDGGDRAVAGVVGAEGGTVVVPAALPGQEGPADISGAAVDVPAGALPTAVAIVIGSAGHLPDRGDGSGTVGPAVFFGPSGLEFRSAATLTVPVDLGAVGGDVDQVLVYTRSAKGKVTLVDPATYVFDLVAGTVSFPASHFSSYQAFGVPGTLGPSLVTYLSGSPAVDVDLVRGGGGAQAEFVYLAEGSNGLVGAIGVGQAGFTRFTFAGGGSQTADGTPRLSFDFGGDVTAVFGRENGEVLVGTPTRVFRIDDLGNVHRFAGTGASGDTGDGGAALSAEFTSIVGLLADLQGNVFVVDRAAARIRLIRSSDGVIQTFAGTGTPGIGADGVAPDQSALLDPADLQFTGGPGMYVADGGRLRLLDPSQPGSPVNATFAGDAAGSTGTPVHGASRLSARFGRLSGLLVDPFGDRVYASDEDAHCVVRIGISEDRVDVVLGTPGTPGLSEDFDTPPFLLDSPRSLVGGGALLIFLDAGNGRVRQFLDPPVMKRPR